MVGKELISLYTVNEAADYLRVHPVTLWRWRKSGNGPRFSRVGHLIMYTQEALEQFVRRGDSHRRKK